MNALELSRGLSYELGGELADRFAESNVQQITEGGDDIVTEGGDNIIDE